MRKREIERLERLLKNRKEQILENIKNANNELKELNDIQANDDFDIATLSSESLIENAIMTQQTKELKEIEYALEKIKDKTYGICEMCEEEINPARLEVKPFAKYCISCREIIEKGQR